MKPMPKEIQEKRDKGCEFLDLPCTKWIEDDKSKEFCPQCESFNAAVKIMDAKYKPLVDALKDFAEGRPHEFDSASKVLAEFKGKE